MTGTCDGKGVQVFLNQRTGLLAAAAAGSQFVAGALATFDCARVDRLAHA